jgi:glutathione S-transferase
MKLYYSPGACSLAPHIVAHEAGVSLTLERVDTATHKTAKGTDYYTINPKGAVPLLELDNGERLSEGPIIAQYLADSGTAPQLAPAPGSMARYRVQEWQNYVTSELHKSFSPLFGNPEIDAAGKASYLAALKKKYAWVDTQLEGRAYLTGDAFTVADAYLFAVTNWARHVGLDLSAQTSLQQYLARVAARPAVQTALRAEGLLAPAEAAA